VTVEPETRIKLQYGLNEADCWRYFAIGDERQRIWERHRQLGVRIVRIFLFDKYAPDPNHEWKLFEAYIQAVLNVGAVPMITFAKFRRPPDDPRAVRWFANQCSDVVWSCIEHWGGEVVRDWYWCVWNEPNSTWIGGGLSFEQYRRIYEEVAHGILRWLKSYLGTRQPRIGGPAVEGFQPFWLDWVYRFISEIDPSLIGFVNWHRYADWRDTGEAGAPADERTLRSMILWQTEDYGARAQSVARLLNGSGVLNICGEWNAHSHYVPAVRARFNQSLFGAAHGASALLHLIRGGADAEMLWTGTDEACGYGVMDKSGTPTPLFHAKHLCSRYLRCGDRIAFPGPDPDESGLQIARVRGDDGRKSFVTVHLRDEPAEYVLADARDCGRLLKIDGATGNQVREETADGSVSFAGYGVAVLTNE